MSKRPKKHKKRRKLSRRARHQNGDAPKSATADAAREVAGRPTEPVSEQPVGTEPQPERPVTEPEPAPAAPANPEPATVSATFTPSTKSDALVGAEQARIGSDLRRLGIQIGAFTLLIAGIGILDAQTGLIGDLGTSLFGLWE
ncbi:MAG: hypothetical protein M3N59_00435 [bacterium]|nr:hypothetical protein [bacterium]